LVDVSKAFEADENGVLLSNDDGEIIWIGGASGPPTHDAPIGSTYFQTDTNQRFVKTIAGSGSDKWEDAQVQSPTGTITASFGAAGNASNKYLDRAGGVPSNKAGIPVDLFNAELVSIDAANENIGTFDVEVYTHDGNSINETLIYTLNVVSSRRASQLGLSISIPTSKQLSTKIINGSAKNVGVTCLVKGTFTL
jgi:hypothetical protein